MKAYCRDFKKGLEADISEQELWLLENPLPHQRHAPGKEEREMKEKELKGTKDLMKGFMFDCYKKDRVSKEWVFKWDSAGELMKKELTCPPVGESGMFPYRCALGKCDECPGDSWRMPRGMDFMVTPEWDIKGLTQITHRINEPGYECREHGRFTNKEKNCKTKCPTCKLRPHEKPVKDPRGLQERNNKRHPSGTYLKEHFVKLMDSKYRKHVW